MIDIGRISFLGDVPGGSPPGKSEMECVAADSIKISGFSLNTLSISEENSRQRS